MMKKKGGGGGMQTFLSVFGHRWGVIYLVFRVTALCVLENTEYSYTPFDIKEKSKCLYNC